jgi:hypothetical protein
VEEELVWGCEYCDREFTTRFGCMVHEKTCTENDSDEEDDSDNEEDSDEDDSDEDDSD